MNLIMPIILIVASVAVFFGYVDPNYKSGTPSNPSDYSTYGVTDLKSELANYEDISKKSTEITQKRDSLIKKRNSIDENEQARLKTLLPSNVDNIRLIIEVNRIAAKRNLVLKNISFTEGKDTSSIGSANTPYGTLTLKFTVTASYNNFLNLLTDLESNLRLLDITDISFNSSDTGLYDFNVSLNTYWLK